MGADVIKVENRKGGDASRDMLPFAGKDDERVSLYFTQYNKNKRGLSLDFYNPECIEILRKLAVKADVLVENFRPGTLEKMGLAPEELLRINPGLIITSISGFGQDGPYRDRAAFDCIGQSMGGLMGVTGEIGGGPLLVGTWVADFTTGTFAGVIPDGGVDPRSVTRVLLCSGKLYWDLAARRAELGEARYSIVRVEQLYPLDGAAVEAALRGVPGDAEVVWCQEEPENQGAWRHMARCLPPHLGGRRLRVVSRPEAASPATGSRAAHIEESAVLMAAAFGPS
jgi:hypothetical protein